MKLHVGRAWSGTAEVEQDCPCPKAPCGLASVDGIPDCPEHTKSLRQIHDEEQCPALQGKKRERTIK